MRRVFGRIGLFTETEGLAPVLANASPERKVRTAKLLGTQKGRGRSDLTAMLQRRDGVAFARSYGA